jgi:hypothetical protein
LSSNEKRKKSYKQYHIRDALEAIELRLDAYVLDYEKLVLRNRDAPASDELDPSLNIQVLMSEGPTSSKDLCQKLFAKEFECLVIGKYGEPGKDRFEDILEMDGKSRMAKKGRLELFGWDPDVLVCLVVHTVKGTSYRKGLLKIDLNDPAKRDTLGTCGLEARRSFVLH